ncbi:MAG: S16 family serine protease [Candidatus Bilamarchaeum sp.]|jgi:uncharacterized protein
MIKQLVILFLLSGSIFAACIGSVSHYVPAVVGNSGGLVNVTITLANGSGNTYISIYPRIGTMTQDSIDTAISYAKKISNYNQTCDMYLTFGEPNTEGLIDGPSAGASLTTMIYALINNAPLRQDTIITGTIDSMGNVGPVGGVYEKVKGAAARGAKFFISPRESVYDMLLLKKLEVQYGIKIMQAETEDEILGFMINNRAIAEPDTISKNRPIPQVPAYNSSGIEVFRSVSAAFLEKEIREIEKLGDSNEQAAAIRSFYQNEIRRQQTMLDKGYYFSAANEAFLNYIDMMTVEAIDSPRIDINKKKINVTNCLNNLPNKTMTETNFELIIGAELRKSWGLNNIKKVEIKDTDLAEDKYSQYNTLSYSQAWCEVAVELIKAVNNTNTSNQVNEALLKDQSKEMLQKAVEAFGNSTDEDLKSRLNIATESDKKGKYGASIFDSVYVIEMSKLANQGRVSASDIKDRAGQLLNETRISLWGKVYQSQAAFLYNDGDYSGSYKIARMASGLDEAVEKMNINFQNKTSPTLVVEEPTNTTNPYLALGAALLAVIAIVAIASRVIKGDGNGRAYNQRARKAYRA